MYLYSANCIQQKIAGAAIREWNKWHSTGHAQWERDPSRFGDLVGYWLSVVGRDGVPNSVLNHLRNKCIAHKWEAIPFDQQKAEAWKTDVVNQLNSPEYKDSVREALERARKSHFDWGKEGVGNMAWSAAFVVTCVRSVEIEHGIADADWLLFRNEAHYQYTLKASLRKSNRYQTISLTEKVKVGDIIVQDRHAKGFKNVLKLKDVTAKGALETHGDIVVEVADGHAITIGGNLEFEPDFDQSGSVRKRQFPLQTGTLVVQEDIRFKQENDRKEILSLRSDYDEYTLNEDNRTKGAPYSLNVSKNPRPRVPRRAGGALHLQSTGRIFALLRLIDDCEPPKDTKKAI